MSILTHFPNLELTGDQKNALENIRDFLDGNNSVFILKGYAGSGKTTMLRGLISYLNAIERKYQLMAPTGRAAKVIYQKTRHEATTIHKGIYSFNDLEEIEIVNEDGSASFQYHYKIRNNPEVYGSVLIVDEASMVSDVLSQGEFFHFGTGYLLRDLFSYARINSASANTKIIFIGDPAQLPPIGMTISPALSEKYLEEKCTLVSELAEMKEVKRHDADNGILDSAMRIRRCLSAEQFNSFDLRENGIDIFNPAYGDFLETYKSLEGSKIIISFKNRTAYQLNQAIRTDKYGPDLPVQPGDTIIVGGNNYNLGIMNGEFGIVSDVIPDTVTRELKLNMRNGEKAFVRLIWRLIELIMPDENGQDKNVKGYMLENYLNGDNYLKPEEQQALYVDFKNRNPKLKPRTEEFKEAIKSDKFFNCILLKYGYAVTCHKAQGGEWDQALVFWDKGVIDHFDFFADRQNRTGRTNPDFYRWAYTAVTRASDSLYCINPPYFNSFSGMSFMDARIQEAYEQHIDRPVAPIEIKMDSEYLQVLSIFKLENEPLYQQDHFLKLYHLLRAVYVEIVKYERVSYEIRYYLKRENDTAAVKFWVNSKGVFKPNFLMMPSATNSVSLFNEFEKRASKLPSLLFLRDTAESVLTKIEFDIETEEKLPFLSELHNALSNILTPFNIKVDDIAHHVYRERYSFARGSEKAVVDFEYDGDGFFGRVVPLGKQCNSLDLIEQLKKTVNHLKQSEHVI